MPTVMGRPTSAAILARSEVAISVGVPAMRHNPATSRNASSIDIGSTIGDVSRKTSNTALLASVYASNRGDTSIRCGHNFRAAPADIAVRIPHALAS